jgi:hypothetical protein
MQIAEIIEQRRAALFAAFGAKSPKILGQSGLFIAGKSVAAVGGWSWRPPVTANCQPSLNRVITHSAPLLGATGRLRAARSASTIHQPYRNTFPHMGETQALTVRAVRQLLDDPTAPIGTNSSPRIPR